MMNRKTVKLITLIIFLIVILLIGYNANSQSKRDISTYKYSAVDTIFLNKWTPIRIQYNNFYITHKHVIQHLNGKSHVYVISEIDKDYILTYKDDEMLIFKFKYKKCEVIYKDKKITYTK